MISMFVLKTQSTRIYVVYWKIHTTSRNSKMQNGYDGKEIQFYYNDEDGKRHYVTMSVGEFITALLRHIPDKQFKTIRRSLLQTKE